MDKIEKKGKDNYDERGFKQWQVYSKFTYKNVYLTLCDTPSGCGPVQMYNYSPIETLETNSGRLEDFKFLINGLIERMINLKQGWFDRTPTAITFVQGVNNYYIDGIDICTNFIDAMTDIGFEHKIYNNIAHGHNTKDLQAFFYLDITKKL